MNLIAMRFTRFSDLPSAGKAIRRSPAEKKRKKISDTRNFFRF